MYNLPKVLPEEKNLVVRISHYFCQVAKIFGEGRIKLPIFLTFFSFCVYSSSVSISSPTHFFLGWGKKWGEQCKVEFMHIK